MPSAREGGPGRPLKVMHVATVAESLRLMLGNQMEAIQAAGYEVVAVSAPGPDAEDVRRRGIRVRHVPLSRRMDPKGDLVALAALVRVIREERPDIVHTHTPKASLLGQWAAMLVGVPVRVHTIHGLYFPGTMTARTRPLFVWMERLTMAPAHLSLSQNEEDVATAKRERIAHPARVRLLGNGIDVRAFDPALFPAARRAEIRRSLGLGPEHLVVGMVARLVVEKGYLEMFEAVKKIAAVEPRARFLFVGGLQPEKTDGLGADALERAGIGHVAQLLGHRNDVPALTSVMDVFALPSHREGVPRSPMEAAAMGVPSVATDIRGCRQVVVDGVTGLLVPVKDPAALADALLELLRDRDKRKRMGAAAREKAAVDFDERRVFERVLRSYEELVGTRTGIASARDR